MAGTSTWRASSTCSRVWGIGPSGAATPGWPIHWAPGDHVLDVVPVPRHVHMGVVALGGLVLDVGNVDRIPALSLPERYRSIRTSGNPQPLQVAPLGDGPVRVVLRGRCVPSSLRSCVAWCGQTFASP